MLANMENLNLTQTVSNISNNCNMAMMFVNLLKNLCCIIQKEIRKGFGMKHAITPWFLFCRHYNMNRIRLVWSRIWNVLSDFFVSVGLSENLSVAIFVMDSLRQLAMKFLDREELANYNFQNEFLRPFVIVMQKSSSAEIRELIVRCIAQMVLSRVTNVKSGWKSVFMVCKSHSSYILISFLYAVILFCFVFDKHLVAMHCLYVLRH